jgi:hypothetical protein
MVRNDENSRLMTGLAINLPTDQGRAVEVAHQLDRCRPGAGSCSTTWEIIEGDFEAVDRQDRSSRSSFMNVPDNE